MRTRFVTFFFALLFVTISSQAFADIYGKIRAKVLDKSSGKPLTGATVRVFGTSTMGAIVGKDGYAIVNRIPSGTVRVQANFVGYETETMEGVRVSADQTVDLTFKLAETSIQGKEQIVRAERAPLVDKSKPKTERNFSTEEIAALPNRESINSVVALSPGVVSDGSNGGFSIRGSRGTDNSVRFDGAEITDPITGQAGVINRAVSKLGISEVQVQTGGVSVEYGNATGGVINTVSRSAGENYEVKMRAQSDVPPAFGTSGNGKKLLPQNDFRTDLSLSGPVPTVENLKFSITGNTQTIQYNNAGSEGLDVRDPDGNTLGQMPHNRFFSRSVNAKLSYSVGALKITANSVYAADNQERMSWEFLYGDYSQVRNQNSIQTSNSVRVNYVVDQNTSIDLLAAYVKNDISIGKKNDLKSYGIFDLFDIYPAKDDLKYDTETQTFIPGSDGIIDIYTPTNYRAPDPKNPFLSITYPGINPLTGHIEGLENKQATSNPYGVISVFDAYGNSGGYLFQNSRQIQLDGNVETQINSENTFRGGFEMRLYNVKNNANQLPWDASSFKDIYDVSPSSYALYIQDKLEYSDIVIVPGIRYDLFNQVVGARDNLTNLFDRSTHPVGMKSIITPRLGVNYSVTDKTQFHFSYGWSSQTPRFTDFYNSVLSYSSARANQIIGNPDLQPAVRKKLEFGFQSELAEDFAADITAFYEDLLYNTGVKFIASTINAYYLQAAEEFGSSRGVEIGIQKRMSNNFGARLNYTISVATGTSSTNTGNYSVLIGAPDPYTGLPRQVPVNEYPLTFDRRHVANFSLDLNFGRGEGPSIGGVHFLQNFSANFLTQFQTGVPYTPKNIRGVQSGEYNSQRQPSSLTTDMTLNRVIPLGDLFGDHFKNSSIKLYASVVNLFNRTEAVTVYEATGLPDNDGSVPIRNNTSWSNDPANGSRDAFGRLLYNAHADYNKDGTVDPDEQLRAAILRQQDSYARRTNYQLPRRVYFGIEFTL